MISNMVTTELSQTSFNDVCEDHIVTTFGPTRPRPSTEVNRRQPGSTEVLAVHSSFTDSGDRVKSFGGLVREC